jgi:hypothetical protein
LVFIFFCIFARNLRTIYAKIINYDSTNKTITLDKSLLKDGEINFPTNPAPSFKLIIGGISYAG